MYARKVEGVDAFFTIKNHSKLTIYVLDTSGYPERGKVMMDAIVGRYRVRMEETGLVLTHPSGMCFDLTAEEALEMMEFIAVYRKSLLALERDTDPQLKRVVVKEPVVVKELTEEV